MPVTVPAQRRLVSWAAFAVTLALLAGCVDVQQPTPSPSTPGESAAATTPVPTQGTGATLPPTPTAGATETATTTIPPTATPTVPATATPSPTPVTEWTEASAISSNHYTAVDLVVDDAGAVHAAAALDGAIWYVTNRSGSWTRHQLSSPPSGRNDQEPTIAGGGPNLFVAFTRYGPNTGFGSPPENIYLTNRTGGGAWSDPAAYGPAVANAPSIKARNGAIYLAYVDGFPLDYVDPSDKYPVRFATNLSGSWGDSVVSHNGTEPVLGLSQAGRYQIVFGDYLGLLPGNGLTYLYAGSAGDMSELVPGTQDDYAPFDMAVDGSDRIDLVYTADSEGPGLFFTRRSDAGWSGPDTLSDVGDFTSLAVAVDTANKVHVVATTVADGAWYFTNRHGTWESKQLLAPSGNWYLGSSAIAVDASGRAQVLFIVGKNKNNAQLYYAASPAV